MSFRSSSKNLGDYAPKTFQWLRMIANTRALSDSDLVGQVLRSLRDRNAVALHVGHGNVIQELKGSLATSNPTSNNKITRVKSRDRW